MSVYIVTFQLSYDDTNYEKLREAIKAYPYWYRQSNNVWFVKPKKHNATEIRNYLSKHLYSGDKLLVIKVVKGWAATGYSDKAYIWLRTHLTDI